MSQKVKRWGSIDSEAETEQKENGYFYVDISPEIITVKADISCTILII